MVLGLNALHLMHFFSVQLLFKAKRSVASFIGTSKLMTGVCCSQSTGRVKCPFN